MSLQAKIAQIDRMESEIAGNEEKNMEYSKQIDKIMAGSNDLQEDYERRI